MTDKGSKNFLYFCGVNPDDFKDNAGYEKIIASENNAKIKLFKLALNGIGISDLFYQNFFESFFDREKSNDDFDKIIDNFVCEIKSFLSDAKDNYIYSVLVTLIEYESQRIKNECCMFYHPPPLETICGLLELGKQQLSLAKKGAKARHKENHQTKNFVFTWLDKHMVEYKSMDDAARYISEKVVPMKFRTVRQWLTEWKKLRSASTA